MPSRFHACGEVRRQVIETVCRITDECHICGVNPAGVACVDICVDDGLFVGPDELWGLPVGVICANNGSAHSEAEYGWLTERPDLHPRDRRSR